MRRLSHVFFSVLILFLFVEIVIISPRLLEQQNQEEEKAKPGSGAEQGGSDVVEQKMGGAHLVESKGGERNWELFSNAAEVRQGKGIWILEVVKVVFYSSDGVTFTVIGQHGTFDSKTKNMRITGHVVTKSSNGYEFDTDEANYNSAERILTSPTAVRMLGPKDEKNHRMTLKGRGMTTTMNNSQMVIDHEVQAEKTLSDGKKMTIQSESAEFSGKSNSAKFVRNVTIEMDTMRLQGPSAVFKYKPGSDLLQSVYADGGIRVSDIDKWATSENVNVDFSENKFTFRGKPRVVQNNDELVGDEIVFLNGGKKVKVQNVKARVDKNNVENNGSGGTN